MTRTKSTYLALLAALLSPMAANADLIDFEGVAASGQQLGVGNNYLEEGFNFFNPGDPTDAAIVGQPTQNTSGSDYYTWNSPVGNNPITLTNLLGSVFGLETLDVGSKSGSNAANFDIIGYFAAGGSVLANVTGSTAFTNLNLGWTGLSYVEFYYRSGDFGAIDNLVVNVPEPGTLALLGIGLFGMALARRKKV